MNHDPFKDQFDDMKNSMDQLTNYDPSKPDSYDNPLPGHVYIHPIEQSNEDDTLIDISWVSASRDPQLLYYSRRQLWRLFCLFDLVFSPVIQAQTGVVYLFGAERIKPWQPQSPSLQFMTVIVQ